MLARKFRSPNGSLFLLVILQHAKEGLLHTTVKFLRTAWAAEDFENLSSGGHHGNLRINRVPRLCLGAKSGAWDGVRGPN